MEKTEKNQAQQHTGMIGDVESASHELGTAKPPSFQLKATNAEPKDTETGDLSQVGLSDQEFNWDGAAAGGIVGGLPGDVEDGVPASPVRADGGAPAAEPVGAADAGPLVGPDPTVTFATVNALSSPAGMPNRIPPRVNTSLTYTVANYDAARGRIELSIEGANDTNGRATIDGAATTEVTAGGAVALSGTTQTTAGNAGNLVVVAKLGGTVIGRSNAFSVSAIPQNWNVSFNSLITGTKRGIAVNNAWESDSGSLADLDQVQRSEKVEYGGGTGIFATTTSGNNSGFLPGDNSPRVDSHGAPVSMLTGIGNITAKQGFIFNDNRSGAANIAAKNSGFAITRDVVANGSGGFDITTTKQGASHTTRGYAVTAGSGSVSRQQAV